MGSVARADQEAADKTVSDIIDPRCDTEWLQRCLPWGVTGCKYGVFLEISDMMLSPYVPNHFLFHPST